MNGKEYVKKKNNAYCLVCKRKADNKKNYGCSKISTCVVWDSKKSTFKANKTNKTNKMQTLFFTNCKSM